MTTDAMHPFPALIRRYCIDYTNVHDLSVCDDIMAPTYVVRSSGWELHFKDYKQTVGRVFGHFPTLGLTVHELVTNGDRLVLRFSEHGASVRDGGAVATWPGIALYTWDGRQLTSCAVEQDFLARDRQLSSGRTEPVEAPHPDPWVARPLAPRPDAEALVRDWLVNARADATVVLDDGTSDRLLDEATLMVDDLFSAGDVVAFRYTQRGRYAGGLAEVPPERIGTAAEVHATGIAQVRDGRVAHVRVIRDRWGLRRRLAGKA